MVPLTNRYSTFDDINTTKNLVSIATRTKKMYHRLLFHVNLFMVWFIHLSIEDDNNLIMKIDNAEHELKYLKHQINMELSTENQTIDEYLMCRSKQYRSIELKILMRELVDEYRNKKCRLPVSNNIHDIEVIEYLILKRFYYVRVFNKELFHHQFLWKMLEEMKKQLPN
ncbi:hypothetical protein Smp_133430 [Schistosoma mansoni]|uniref:hypothetical protein n=1 Tax=Schistosoma mansoni TaxID=6183 RepID=UPI00022C86EB|nr:hypothetical protein Smp_133430 [Schistosoma mansoni]|eukprot:XP_018646249.1 hypothetical protein Smp_133430 [Schistosoma mansoni]